VSLARCGTSVVLVAWLIGTRSVGAATANDARASASTVTRERAIAEALFRDGKALVEAERFEEGCAKFQESQRLDPALGTLLYLGTCYAQIGRTASAWAAFQSAVEMARRVKDPSRESLARRRERDLEAKLSRVLFAVERPVAGLTIRVDGLALGPGALSTPLPFDPGPHSIEVSAPGKRPWTTTLDLEQGPVTRVVKVAPLVDRAALTDGSSPGEDSRPATDRASSIDWRVPGYAALGLGIAGVAVGTYFGLRAYSQSKDADKSCVGSVCTQQGLDGHEAARDSATYSNLGFAVAIVGVAAGAYLLYFRSHRAPDQAALWIRAGVGHMSAGGEF